jgi:hypothetical protein
MSRGLRRVGRSLAAVAGSLVLAAMVLTGAAPGAGAAPATGPAPAPGRAAATGSPGGPGAPAVPGARAVCAAPAPGRSACMSLRRDGVRHFRGLSAASGVAAPAGYSPADLSQAYGLPSGSAGRGETVAVVDAYDDPTAEADLQVYRAEYHLPVCDTANGCFAKVNQEGLAGPLPPAAGSAGPQSAGWDIEEALDVDMVSAVCPNCRIVVVEANSNADSDLYAAEDAAVALGAKFVSDSWGGAEYPEETADDVYFDHPGVVITAAAGDNEYGVYYPAASRYVTAVGGTTMAPAITPGGARVWNQTAWLGTGSGCSFYEPKPAWQTDPGCANRTVNDVSAVADPQTGVAIYNTSSDAGWDEVGGTSAATAIIAATYALAGPPVAGSYPSSYPYAHPSALTDVTSGTNNPGGCTPSYLCTAGPGYDGPTGLGTPDLSTTAGVQAFSGGAGFGTVSGTVSATVAGTSRPLAGVTVSVAGYAATTTTNASGGYTLAVPAGSYDVSAARFGYQTATAASVPVTQGHTTTQNFTPRPAPRYYTLSGTVADGSGHGWPLYAQVGIAGYPGATVYTNPYTGRYSVSLPERASYTVSVTPVYPGYRAATMTVPVGTANVTRNVSVAVDVSTCAAPGYADKDTGVTQTFTGWQGTTPRDGWTVTDNIGNGEVWNFSNPTHLPPPPGGDADFASVDPQYGPWFLHPPDDQDTSLVSPVINLSAMSSPVITFDSAFLALGSTATVDLSLDGGQTWTTVWQRAAYAVAEVATIPIPAAAGKPDVRVRFHFVDPDEGHAWEVDNVFVGDQVCAAVPGGLAAGIVTDANTGKPVNGASVSAGPGQSATSGPDVLDPGVPGGFYEVFAAAGSARLTVSDPDNYSTSAQTVAVAASAVTRHDVSLAAGDLAVSASGVSVTRTLGGAAGAGKLRLTDTGSVPVRVKLDGTASGFTPTAGGSAGGAPLEMISGRFSPAALLTAHTERGGTLSASRCPRPRRGPASPATRRLSRTTPSATTPPPAACTQRAGRTTRGFSPPDSSTRRCRSGGRRSLRCRWRRLTPAARCSTAGRT